MISGDGALGVGIGRRQFLEFAYDALDPTMHVAGLVELGVAGLVIGHGQPQGNAAGCTGGIPGEIFPAPAAAIRAAVIQLFSRPRA